MIELIHGQLQLLLADFLEVGFLWEVLAQQTVGVLVEPALP